MKEYSTDRIRNVGFISHGGAGKTTLTEAILFNAKTIDRMGKVEDGTTVSDYDPEEVARKISISTSLAPYEWMDHKVNILDTPGYFDFEGEVVGALRAVEGVVILTCAVAGVEVGTEKSWDHANNYHLPRIFFINKMDRENANFYKVLDQLRESFGNRIIPIQIPIGSEQNFKGLVDVIEGKAKLYEGKEVKVVDIPGDLKDKYEEYKSMLIEAVAETDDSYLEKFFNGEELIKDEIMDGLKKGVTTGSIYPVLCGSCLKNIGITELMNAIVNFMPSPSEKGSVTGKNPKTGNEEKREINEGEPFSALVFKTVADPYVGKLSLFKVYSGVITSDSSVYNATKENTEKVGQLYMMRGKKQVPVPKLVAGDIGAVAKLQYTLTGDTLCDVAKPILYEGINFPEPSLSLAIEPNSRGDEEKISNGLHRLLEEDPTFKVEKNVETGQILVSGMGELHIEVITKKLKNKFGVDCTLSEPRIPYRETIKGRAKVEGKHKKQTGGHGQYGHVWIEFEPLPDKEFEFEDKIFGGVVPKQYIPAVEKGLREAMKHGILAKYPVVNIKATLYDGSYHPVDSSEMSFKIAAQIAFKKGMEQANPVLLEPIMRVEVTVPEQYMGDVIGDLNKRRGRILGMEPKGNLQLVIAEVPLAEMHKYGSDLRSITQARGFFKMNFERYEEVPAHISQKIIAEAKAKMTEEEE